jgi:hypothetical protein
MAVMLTQGFGSVTLIFIEKSFNKNESLKNN